MEGERGRYETTREGENTEKDGKGRWCICVGRTGVAGWERVYHCSVSMMEGMTPRQKGYEIGILEQRRAMPCFGGGEERYEWREYGQGNITTGCCDEAAEALMGVCHRQLTQEAHEEASERYKKGENMWVQYTNEWVHANAQQRVKELSQAKQELVRQQEQSVGETGKRNQEPDLQGYFRCLRETRSENLRTASNKMEDNIAISEEDIEQGGYIGESMVKLIEQMYEYEQGMRTEWSNLEPESRGGEMALLGMVGLAGGTATQLIAFNECGLKIDFYLNIE